MAVRKPLKYVADTLQEMTSAEIAAFIPYCKWAYALHPSVDVSTLSSRGNGTEYTRSSLLTTTDTRKINTQVASGVSSFPSQGSLGGIGTVTTNVELFQYVLNQNSELFQGRTKVDNRPPRTYPIYWDGSAIRPMSQQDMFDTFYSTALTELADGTDQDGTFRISTDASLAGHTGNNATKVWSVGVLPGGNIGPLPDGDGSGSVTGMIDTRANAGAYSIPSQVYGDQPTTINTYTVLQTYSGDNPPATLKPLYIDSAGDAFQFKLERMPYYNSGNNSVDDDLTYLSALIGKDMMAYASYKAASTNQRIRYHASSGNIRGSQMTDTVLNGSGAYATHQFNLNNYTAAMFPNGSPVTQSTYTLRIENA